MTYVKKFPPQLNGRWFENYGRALCPVCQPEGRGDQSALKMSEGSGGRFLVHCKKIAYVFREILGQVIASTEHLSPLVSAS